MSLLKRIFGLGKDNNKMVVNTKRNNLKAVSGNKMNKNSKPKRIIKKKVKRKIINIEMKKNLDSLSFFKKNFRVATSINSCKKELDKVNNRISKLIKNIDQNKVNMEHYTGKERDLAIDEYVLNSESLSRQERKVIMLRETLSLLESLPKDYHTSKIQEVFLTKKPERTFVS